jgi:hypothetical protein
VLKTDETKVPGRKNRVKVAMTIMDIESLAFFGHFSSVLLGSLADFLQLLVAILRIHADAHLGLVRQMEQLYPIN